MLKNHSHVSHRCKFATKLSTKLASLVSVVFLGVFSTVDAADAQRGSQLSQTCLGCHGLPGLNNPGPVYQVPMIGGQNAEYIVAALQAYKNKDRPHPTMRAQAASLSDQDMQDIAAYFSSIEGNSRPSVASASLIAEGEKAAAVCATCHGKTGDGPTPTFPKLAGQYNDYMVHALKEYRSGARKNIVMNGQAQNLSIQEIKALSAYFSSQGGGLSAPEVESIK